jgi:hypothetical protein
MEKVRDGFCDGAETPASLEERLEEKVVKVAVWEWGRVVEGEVYRGVEEYDPVLRSHCRLE